MGENDTNQINNQDTMISHESQMKRKMKKQEWIFFHHMQVIHMYMFKKE